MPQPQDGFLMLVLHSETDEDRKLSDEILNHLRPLCRRVGIELQDLEHVRPGDDVRQARARTLARASMVVLLVSADFLASNFLQEREIPTIRERCKLAQLSVVPMVIRSCAWEHDPWLATLRPLPSDGKPIASLPRSGDERDQVLAKLAKELTLRAEEQMSVLPTVTSPVGEKLRNREASTEHIAPAPTVDFTTLRDDLAASIAHKLQARLSKDSCPEHQNAARVVILGRGDWSRLSVECCCAPFANEVRRALVHASGEFSFHIAVRARDDTPHHVGITATNEGAPWALEDVLLSSKVRWAGIENTVEIVKTTWYGTSLLRVYYRDHCGNEHSDFLDRDCEQSIDVTRKAPFVYSLGRHPSDVPRLFTDRKVLFGVLRKLHAKRRSRALVEAFINEVAWRLSAPARPLRAVHALELAKRSPAWPVQEDEIIWEVFDTASFDEALRRLERVQDPRRLRIAICVDPDVDHRVFKAFDRKIPASAVHLNLRESELMLADSFRRTTVRVARELDRLGNKEIPDRLEFVDLGLEPGQPCWSAISDLPCAYSGLGPMTQGHLEDPIFFLDILNAGTREARIYSAYIHVRLRQIKAHGVAEPRLLRPITTIELPLNSGHQRYTEVALREPVLVPPGTHARLQVRLDDAGFCWRGVVDIGLLYGDGNVLRVPALSIFL